MAPEVEARIIALRKNNPGFGPRTILTKLRKELDHLPSRSAIYRCLVRRLAHVRPRHRRSGMPELIVTCECGFESRGAEEELIEAVRKHGREAHNMDVTREQVLAMAKPVDEV